MKKIYFSLAVLTSLSFTAQNSFETITLPGNETYWDGSDYSGTSNGAGLFDTTIVENGLEFPNQYDTTWGANYGYWSAGWAFTNETPDTLQGYAGLYSSFAGGANTGTNYAIGKNGSEITVANGQESYILEVNITNTNYAASSMQTGDAFAKPFGSPNDANGNPDGTNGEDWFLLTITGWDAQGNVTDSVLFYLADYRFADSTQDYIVKNWTAVDLSTLGMVNKVTFKLSSSDVGQYGMNTPAFFAIDDVVTSAASIVEVESDEITAYPNPATDRINLLTSIGSTVQLFDIEGKLVYESITTNSRTVITTSGLKNGVYFIKEVTENSIKNGRFIKI